MLPQSPRLSQTVSSFLLFCESKNLTAGTVGWYGDKLSDVVRLLDDPPVTDISLDDLRRLVAYWAKEHRRHPQLAPRDKGTGLSPNTINGYIKAIRAMCRFLLDEGLVPADPSTRLRPVRVGEERRTVLTPEEVRQIVASSPGCSFTQRRNRCLFVLLVDSGLRIGEAVGLKVGDIDRAARTATVLGKGRKVRTVPFGRQTARALASYLVLHPQALVAEALLFLTDEGDPLVRRRAQHVISGMARRAGITDRRVGPHALRRTFASLWISNGGDAFALQRILGHTTMEMVNRYVRLSTEALSRSHALSGPLDRLSRG